MNLAIGVERTTEYKDRVRVTYHRAKDQLKSMLKNQEGDYETKL